jgi:polar amino acid transport system substrate-binding protein
MSQRATEQYDATIADIPHRIVYAYLDEPPFGAPGPDGHAIGYDAELAEKVLRAIGVKHIDVVLVKFPELIDGVTSGRWTMNTGMFVTPERAQSVAFSRPIWALIDGFVARLKSDIAIQTRSDRPPRCAVIGGSGRPSRTDRLRCREKSENGAPFGTKPRTCMSLK